MPARNCITSPHLPEVGSGPGPGVLVGASILSADFAQLGEECRRAIDAGADLLHLDVMDGHFVPNLTMGPALCASLRRALPDVTLDVHLMVEEPAKFVRPFAEAGADHFTFHIEAEGDAERLAEQVNEHGMTAGLAINPPTDVEAIVPHLEAFDLILIMSVNPGFAGQSFIADVLEKIRRIKPMLPPWPQGPAIQIDGGVNAQTAQACREAGCDILVAASAIFGTADYRHAVAGLKGAATPATRPG